MWFQIESVQADGQWVPLSDSQSSGWLDNTFTMVVGQNAIGKSRLLRKIVSNYIFAQGMNTHEEPITRSTLKERGQHPHYFSTENIEWDESPDINEAWSSSSEWTYHLDGARTPHLPNLLYIPAQFQGGNKYGEREVEISFGSALCPSRVIAVSTGRHDRFPSLSQSKKNPSGIKYSYISSERPNASSVPNSLGSLVDALLKGQQNAARLSNILEYLEFEPYIDIKISVDTKQLNRLTEIEKSELHHKCTYDLPEYLSEKINHIPFIDLQHYKFFETLQRQKNPIWRFIFGISRKVSTGKF